MIASDLFKLTQRIETLIRLTSSILGEEGRLEIPSCRCVCCFINIMRTQPYNNRSSILVLISIILLPTIDCHCWTFMMCSVLEITRRSIISMRIAKQRLSESHLTVSPYWNRAPGQEHKQLNDELAIGDWRKLPKEKMKQIHNQPTRIVWALIGAEVYARCFRG